MQLACSTVVPATLPAATVHDSQTLPAPTAVTFLFTRDSWAAAVAIFSNMSVIIELTIDMALVEMRVSGCTCRRGTAIESQSAARLACSTV